jgi:hypothetical protein
VKVCQWNEIHSLAVKQMGKPAVYVGNGLEYNTPEDDEIWKFVQSEVKAIYGETNEFYNVMSGLVSGSMFFFDSTEEQYRFYRIFEQPLTDSSAIYACTYDSDGQCQTENT